MKQVYRFDTNGQYLEPVLLDDDQSIPNDCTYISLPQPNWKPVFNNGNWVETATEEDKNPPIIIEKTLEERILELEEKLKELGV
jgi:hypothetical protein